jgi:hypothetical protein
MLARPLAGTVRQTARPPLGLACSKEIFGNELAPGTGVPHHMGMAGTTAQFNRFSRQPKICRADTA